jgi:16S rRNA (uracil1498-N3)-methyltransferase
MRLNRVHAEVPVGGRVQLELTGTAANHIGRVLRLRAGDPLILFDDAGGEYAATVAALLRHSVRVTVGDFLPVDRESPLHVTLAQGISRGERMDIVVQKATELGVKRIVPVTAERTVVRLNAAQAANRLRHWRAIAIAACEQCGRNRLPDLATPVDFFDVLPETFTPNSTRILLSPHAGLRIDDLRDLHGGVTVLIGPEGGLDEVEQEAALAAGFKSVRMGPRVLRTETAAIAALTILQRYFGDL